MSSHVPRELRLGTAVAHYRGGHSTAAYAILGHPIAHSLSPTMQQAAFRACHLDAVYLPFDVPRELLPECVKDVRDEARLRGCNVTVPLKEDFVPHLDEQDATTRLTGAVNTVRIDRTTTPARLVGYNTDAAGLVAALDEKEASIRGATVVVVGAGGAARAAVAAVLQAGAAELRVLNRTPAKARQMLAAVLQNWSGPVPRHVCASLSAGDLLRDATLLLQCTSIPFHEPDASPVSLQHASSGLFVFDMVYGTRPTALLREARQRGLRRADGRGMLVHQGAAAFRIWTGLEPPLGLMVRSVENELARRTH